MATAGSKPATRMTRRPEAQPVKKRLRTDTANASKPSGGLGELKLLGGSKVDSFNNVVASQTLRSLWVAQSSADATNRQVEAALAAMMGIRPRDEIEGMLAAQLVACHSAAIECYRRAMIGDQSFPGWDAALKQAAKLSRTYAALVETLDRRRGKGRTRSARSGVGQLPAVIPQGARRP